jgi:hypothetical protein
MWRRSRFAACGAFKLAAVTASERDNTRDWLVPAASTPPLLGELELRIDEAMAIALSCERAVEEVGTAAIGAARQAARAAELAERASAAALDASRGATAPPSPPESLGLLRFTERADRLVERLRALEHLPRRPGPSGAVPGARR